MRNPLQSEFEGIFLMNSLTMIHPEQKRIYQSMTPEDKVNAALNLYHYARELKAAGLRARHPDWSEKQIQDQVREIFLNATT